MTRFEDRFKQPLGISVNFTSYAARLLTQARAALPTPSSHKSCADHRQALSLMPRSRKPGLAASVACCVPAQLPVSCTASSIQVL